MVRQRGDTREKYWYSAYEQLPFEGAGIDLRHNTNYGDFYGRDSFGSGALSTSNYSNAIAAIEDGQFGPKPSQRTCPKCQCYFMCRG